MVNLYIDNISINVPKNSTVLQACDSLGIDVPRFCFHERLLIAGNCRMCLVEIEKSPKPVASCALPVAEGMKIFTKTPLVKKAQEGVLEFLLLNHPLDCPICDQGGECDLQDQVMLFGSDSSRFYEYKRGVEDKNCGPLIKTIMTRCIHCTRCVRFSTEIAGVPDLGTLGRGTNTQIGTYIEKVLKSELSGNIIDLCPVGALTSKPYAFKARSWELKSVNSIDVSDSCGSNIVLSVKGNEVMRVLPRLNENINEEWISDKTRFSYDGLNLQRLGTPLNIISKSKKSNIVNWEESFNILFSLIFKEFYNLDFKLNIIFGKDVDLESALVLKHFFNKLNCFSLYFDSNFCSNSSDIFYKFNSKIKNVEDYDVCILVNCNTRVEASMLNLHLRKGVINGNLEVGYFGPSADFTFPVKHLGLNNKNFLNLIKGKHVFAKKLIKAKNPLLIFGGNSFKNNELLLINSILKKNLKNFSSFNILNIDAASVGLRDLGIKGLNSLFSNNSKNNVAFNNSYNLYINTNLKSSQINFLSGISNSSIYCGSHGVPEASKSSLILPGRAFSEKKSHYLNLEGLLQNTNVCYKGLSNSREDWKIFNAFFAYISTQVDNYKSSIGPIFIDFFDLKFFLIKEYPFLSSLNRYNNFFSFVPKNGGLILSGSSKFNIYRSAIINFYKTNIVSSVSLVMSKCFKASNSLNFK